MTPKTILILPYTPTLSHISRPLEIARQLNAYGFRIVFAGFKSRHSKLSLIEGEGFQTYPLFEMNPDVLFQNIREKKLEFVSEPILGRMIKDDIILFDKLKPDLVLSDGRFSAMISSQICDIPHGAIVNASSTEFRSLPYIPFFNNVLFNYMGRNAGFKMILNKLNLKMEMSIFDTAVNVFQKFSSRHNLSHPVTATNCLAGKDFTLLADIPEYFPIQNQPRHYHYIGPITWKSSAYRQNPKWWPVDAKQKPTIYITMGTTGEKNLFSKVYDIFRQSRMVSIVTTGSQSNFNTIPGNIHVTDFMDGEAILEYADMVVCHGGNGTIYQALSFGKPIIGIPTIPDQEFNMRRVEELGVGIKITMQEALKNPKRIIEAADYLLENKTRFNARLQLLQKRINEYSGAQMAADIIKNYLA